MISIFSYNKYYKKYRISLLCPIKLKKKNIIIRKFIYRKYIILEIKKLKLLNYA